jgi:hypothetical protein
MLFCCRSAITVNNRDRKNVFAVGLSRGALSARRPLFRANPISSCRFGRCVVRCCLSDYRRWLFCCAAVLSIVLGLCASFVGAYMGVELFARRRCGDWRGFRRGVVAIIGRGLCCADGRGWHAVECSGKLCKSGVGEHGLSGGDDYPRKHDGGCDLKNQFHTLRSSNCWVFQFTLLELW